MTIATNPYSDRIVQAGKLDGAARRAVALVILGELSSARLPVIAATSDVWAEMSGLLLQCAADVEDGRVAYFLDLARRARCFGQAVRAEVAQRRPGGGVPHARPMPRTWKPQRVVEVA